MKSTPPQQRAILESVAEDLRAVTELRRRSSQQRTEQTAVLLTTDVGIEFAVRLALDGTGLEIYPATTAAEAQLTIGAPFVRLFVIDQRIVGALDVIRAARAGVEPPPVIAIAANEEQRLAQEAGAAAAFTLPVDVEELRASVRWLLGAEA